MRRWTTFRSTGASRATSASSRAPKATTGWVTVHHVLLSLVLCTSCRPQLAWAGEGAADRHSQPARSDRAVPKPARAATRPPPRRATTCGTTLIQVGPPIPGVCKLGGGGCLCSNSASFKLGKAPVRAVCEPRMGHGLCVAGTDIVGEIFYSANFYTTTAVGIIKTHAEEQVTTRAAPRRVKLRSLPGCLPSCPPALCLSLSSPLARNNISLLGPVSLRAQAGSPLFLYLPYQNVHSPNQEPGPFSPPAALPPTPTAGPPPPCHHAHFETDSTLVAIPRVASSALLCATEELPLPPCDSLLALPLFAPQHRGRPTPTPHGRPAAGRSLRCRSTQTCSICSTLGSATSRQP